MPEGLVDIPKENSKASNLYAIGSPATLAQQLAILLDSKCPLQLLGVQDTEPRQSHPKRILHAQG